MIVGALREMCQPVRQLCCTRSRSPTAPAQAAACPTWLGKDVEAVHVLRRGAIHRLPAPTSARTKLLRCQRLVTLHAQ